LLVSCAGGGASASHAAGGGDVSTRPTATKITYESWVLQFLAGNEITRFSVVRGEEGVYVEQDGERVARWVPRLDHLFAFVDSLGPSALGCSVPGADRSHPLVVTLTVDWDDGERTVCRTYNDNHDPVHWMLHRALLSLVPCEER